MQDYIQVPPSASSSTALNEKKTITKGIYSYMEALEGLVHVSSRVWMNLTQLVYPTFCNTRGMDDKKENKSILPRGDGGSAGGREAALHRDLGQQLSVKRN